MKKNTSNLNVSLIVLIGILGFFFNKAPSPEIFITENGNPATSLKINIYGKGSKPSEGQTKRIDDNLYDSELTYSWSINNSPLKDMQKIKGADEYYIDLNKSYIHDEFIEIQVTVSDGNKSTQISKSYEIKRKPINANISLNTSRTYKAGETLVAEANKQDPDKESLTYKWEVDGEPAGTARILNYIIPMAGEHKILLSVSDKLGRSTESGTKVNAEWAGETRLTGNLPGQQGNKFNRVILDGNILTNYAGLSIMAGELVAHNAKILSSTDYQAASKGTDGGKSKDGSTGKNGDTGDDGKQGAEGRSAGSITIDAQIFSGNLSITNNGQPGGQGGQGGPGGSGGKGKRGNDASDQLTGCGHSGGDGGNGGNGGTGGNGGIGGQGGKGGDVLLNIAKQFSGQLKIQNQGAAGGKGGDKGTGGARGAGGEGGSGSLYCKGGHGGPAGVAGKAGKPGGPGDPGSAGNIKMKVNNVMVIDSQGSASFSR